MSQNRIIMCLIFIIAVIGLILGSVAIGTRFKNEIVDLPSKVTHKSSKGIYIFKLSETQFDNIKNATTTYDSCIGG